MKKYQVYDNNVIVLSKGLFRNYVARFVHDPERNIVILETLGTFKRKFIRGAKEVTEINPMVKEFCEFLLSDEFSKCQQDEEFTDRISKFLKV